MIKTLEKYNCCGCSACANVCPKACITMQADREGFLYPQMDATFCIDCGLCEKVCPFISESEFKNPLVTYAAINPSDNERFRSSSGGIFTMLMRETLRNGGVIFGAAFDEDWNVHHIAIEREEDIPLLQGSKYVQSAIGNNYRIAKKYLKTGREVLFSGTACQIEGLKRFLQNKYENLITVDIVCHGVPSPKIWNEYITTFEKYSSIKHISFRDKQPGWTNYNFTIDYEDGSKTSESHNVNLYMQGFLRDLYNRPSCHNCKIKAGRCSSDITLGDFWGIDKVYPELNDNRGVSVVLVNTQKGNDFIKKVNPKLKITTFEQAIAGNPCIIKNTPENKWRDSFWEFYNNEFNLLNSIKTIVNQQNPSIVSRAIRKIKSCLLQV